MAYSYDPTLAAPLDRARHALGDIEAPGLLPDETYTAQLAANTTTTTIDGEPVTTINEAAAIRALAAGLAAYYATKPTSLADSGSSISWGKRIDQWNLIANGLAGGASAGRAKGFKLRRGPFHDYTTATGDQL